MNIATLRHRFVLILLGAAALGMARADGDKSADTEQPIEYSLLIDGQEVSITPDTPVQVTVNGKQFTAKLAVKPDRLFSTAGLSFRYPVGHAFEIDKSTPGITQWTLSGNHNTLILTRAPSIVDPADLVSSTADEMTKKLGEKNVKRSEGKISLGSIEYPCTNLDVNLLDSKSRNHLVGFKGKNGVFMMIVQDTLNDDGSDSGESKMVAQLLNKTLKVD